MPLTSLFPRARAAARADRFPPTDDVLEDVRRLNQEYIWAVLANDAGWFDASLADDAVVLVSDGRRLGKSGFVRLLEEDPRAFEVLTVRDVTVRAYGAVVQVDADAPWTMADGTRGVSRYLATWVWQDGRWRAVSLQTTTLPPAPKPT
jgi:ketosteroid isomerase-like protein